MQNILVTLEIVSGVAALGSLAWTVIGAYQDWKDDTRTVTKLDETRTAIAAAEALAGALHDKGSLLSIQGRQPEAQEKFAERNMQRRSAEALKASLAEAPEAAAKKKVTFSRRVLRRAAWTAGLSIIAISAGVLAGATGAAQQPSPNVSQSPSPSAAS
ncbi:hypothetical protein J2Y66_003461 [Paenarthrobacter nitroguajacolicus]|uniref:hypothetical protein n=1 Tax=Paenarthrobacter nitroguajacolicus TaxID=211146 RepID=UPI00285704B8|nr:hypothetical protein [Paenarthrobacter nitroguajacolicus]MDR6988953.1 hypothetical protein [Paenarthrobacter nitroguajacolicus]